MGEDSIARVDLFKLKKSVAAEFLIVWGYLQEHSNHVFFESLVKEKSFYVL